MKKQKLLIALLSVVFCFSLIFGLAKTEIAKAETAPVTVAEMIENADALRPAFNYQYAERLSVSNGVISCYTDGHFFYCEEVDAVAFDITLSAGTNICFALRTDGGGCMWNSHGYYAYIYQTETAAYAELYKVTDCNAWQTAETQLAKGDIADLFDGNAHSVVYSFDETSGALTLTVDGVSIVGADSGTVISKTNSNFKIARVTDTTTLYTVSATGADPEPEPEPEPEPDPEPEVTGIALTDEIMLENQSKLLPVFNYSGAERLTVANGQIASWEDGNFYYKDLVDSVEFTFSVPAGSTQSMLFIALHVASANVPWSSTGYFAFIQGSSVGIYKIDADDVSAWEGGLLGEKVTVSANIFDGEEHVISFGVSGKTLSILIDGEGFDRTFEDSALSVVDTEFGISANGAHVYYVGESTLQAPIVEVDYTGSFTNIETLIAEGALRADYNYNGDFHLVKENGFVVANEHKMSINATITAIDFDIVVTAGASLSFSIRATSGGDIWDVRGYSVWLDGTTLKMYDLSESWHDAADKTATVVNIFDGERHNIKMYAFDDENDYVQVGISIDGSEFVKLVDASAPTTLTGHTEFWLKSVNDNGVRFKVTAPEGTQHNNGESVVTPPTCTEDGYTTTTCQDCGKVVVSTPVESQGHDYESEVTPPTCIVDGYTTYTCSVCGDDYQEAGEEATGHSHESTVVEPTCEDRGYTLYECSCGDNYMEDFQDELGHDLSQATCTTPATCQRENCEHTEGEALGHSYGDWTVTKEATETEAGEKSRTCESCGETETEVIPVLEPSSDSDSESGLEGGETGCMGSVSGSVAGVLLLGASIFAIRRKRK